MVKFQVLAPGFFIYFEKNLVELNKVVGTAGFEVISPER